MTFVNVHDCLRQNGRLMIPFGDCDRPRTTKTSWKIKSVKEDPSTSSKGTASSDLNH